MPDQEKTAITKKRRGPKATGWGTLIGVRLQPDLLELLDEARGKTDPAPSRPEYIRQLVEERLKVEIEDPPPSTEADPLPPSWVREAAARFLLSTAFIIRKRPGSNSVRLAQADFYERLAEIALDGRLPRKPRPKPD